MTELRRAFFDESAIVEDLPPDLKTLATLQAAAAALLFDHAELYKLLLERIEQDGSSVQLRAIALDAAGNLGSVLQASRNREDQLAALALAPGFAAFPILVFDQLFYSFTLLAAPGEDADEPPAHLDADTLDGLIASDHVQKWLTSTNADVVFAGPLATRFRNERNAEE
jgi:hypothetical protein